MATVFVVDDERSYRHYISARLVRGGHDVKVAEGGDEAITLAATSRPDVLIVDWRLGSEGSGLRVAAGLQRSNPALRTILITGYTAEALFAAADVSIFRCLEKPFDIEKLVLAVDEALADAESEESPV